MTATMLQLPPCDIRFSQDSICRRFQNGNSVNETIQCIKCGIYRVEQFPVIEVVRFGDSYYSLDNRRLYVFRVLQVEGYLKVISVYPIRYTSWYSRKFTSKNGGISIRVRGVTTFPHSLCPQQDIGEATGQLSNLSLNPSTSTAINQTRTKFRRQPTCEVESLCSTSPLESTNYRYHTASPSTANTVKKTSYDAERNPTKNHAGLGLNSSSSVNQGRSILSKPRQRYREVTTHGVIMRSKLEQQPSTSASQLTNDSNYDNWYSRLRTPSKSTPGSENVFTSKAECGTETTKSTRMKSQNMQNVTATSTTGQPHPLPTGRMWRSMLSH